MEVGGGGEKITCSSGWAYFSSGVVFRIFDIWQLEKIFFEFMSFEMKFQGRRAF